MPDSTRIYNSAISKERDRAEGVCFAPNVMLWKLDTILQEKGNCHLYEKLGYHQTGKIYHKNDVLDIVYYEKVR